jgi:hypothetical protein
MRSAACLLVLLAFVAAGCGSNSKTSATTATSPDESNASESAARFVVAVQAQLKRGQFAKAWKTLHPAEKRVVTVQRLASCYPRDQFPGTVTFRARNARDVRWTVPGGETEDAKEITIVATSTGQPKQTFKQHVVRENGAWKWMLSNAYFKQAKAGTC